MSRPSRTGRCGSCITAGRDAAPGRRARDDATAPARVPSHLKSTPEPFSTGVLGGSGLVGGGVQRVWYVLLVALLQPGDPVLACADVVEDALKDVAGVEPAFMATAEKAEALLRPPGWPIRWSRCGCG